ncbi:MAG: hypothetical protein ACR2O2_07495, partial [Ruegeria sp.]
YTLKGPLASPEVAVNPLSGLAPLFLRDLMRPPVPQVPQGPEVTNGQTGAAPKTEEPGRTFGSPPKDH